MPYQNIFSPSYSYLNKIDWCFKTLCICSQLKQVNKQVFFPLFWLASLRLSPHSSILTVFLALCSLALDLPFFLGLTSSGVNATSPSSPITTDCLWRGSGLPTGSASAKLILDTGFLKVIFELDNFPCKNLLGVINYKQE